MNMILGSSTVKGVQNMDSCTDVYSQQLDSYTEVYSQQLDICTDVYSQQFEDSLEFDIENGTVSVLDEGDWFTRPR